jgi:hypothetical protein
MTTMIDTSRNPAWPAVEVSNRIVAQMGEIADAGFTRPDVLAAFTKLEVEGINDSTVYRAQKGKIHAREVEIFDKLYAAVQAGDVQPRVKSRKLKVADIADKAYQAAALLATLGEKPKAAELQAFVEQLRAILPEPKVDEPEVDSLPGDEPGEDTDGDQSDQPEA